MLKHKSKPILSIIFAIILFVSSMCITPVDNTSIVSAATKAVKSLTIKKSKIKVKVGYTKGISFKIKAGKDVSKKVTAKSSNNNIATVEWIDSDGICIYGRTPGKVTITVTTRGKNTKGKKITKKIKVTVVNSPTPTGSTQQTNQLMETNPQLSQNNNSLAPGLYESNPEPTSIPNYNGNNGITTPQPTPVNYVQTLKDYISKNGGTDSSGNKGIADSRTTSTGGTFTYAITNKNSSIEFGCILNNSSGDSSMVILSVPLPSKSAAISFTYPSVPYNEDFSVNITSIKTENSISFLKDGSELSEALNSLHNVTLDGGCLCWNNLLKNKLGFGLYELGFTNYR